MKEQRLNLKVFLFMFIKIIWSILPLNIKNLWEYPPESQRFLHPPKSYYLDVDIDLRGRSVEEYMKKEYIYKTKEDMLY